MGLVFVLLLAAVSVGPWPSVFLGLWCCSLALEGSSSDFFVSLVLLYKLMLLGDADVSVSTGLAAHSPLSSTELKPLLPPPLLLLLLLL